MIKPGNLPVVILLSVQCALVLAHSQPDLDSNKVLTDFIWSKIISNSKNSPSSSSSKSVPPRIPLVTIPYKPSSSSLSRRSSYPLSSSSRTSSNPSKTSSQNPTPSASSSSYTFESGTESIAKKYFSDSKGGSSLSEQPFGQYNPASSPSSASTQKVPAPQVKSSYSGPETGKNYFVTAFQPQSENGKNLQQLSKSVYDLVPMPTYGYSKFGGGAEQNNLYPSKKTLEIVPMIGEGKQYAQPMEPQIIEVTPDDQPIQVVFRSTSTRVQVRQIHTPMKAEEVETTRTEEEPQRVMHQLLRPVIQEVFEVIQPYRRVTQEVRPVLEEVHTVVSKNAPPNGPQGQGQHNQPMGYGPTNQRAMFPQSNGNQNSVSNIPSPFSQPFGQMSPNFSNNQNDNYGSGNQANNNSGYGNKAQNYG